MKEELQEINFENQQDPKSYFEIIRIEELLQRDLGHDIGKSHLVKFYVIFFIYEGRGYHTIDFTDYSYSEGTVLLIRKNQIQKFFTSPNVKGYLMVFTDEFIIGHLNKIEALNTLQLFNDSLSYPKIKFNTEEEFSDFLLLIRKLELEYQRKDDFSTSITRSVLHIVITKLFRTKAIAGHHLKRNKSMTQFFEFQYLVEKNIFKSRKVHYYSKLMGVSSKTINNIVNSAVNNSAKAFIDDVAIIHIKRLLISTDHSIKEISYTAGFSDPTNFYKYFKKFTDKSPEVFRQARGGDLKM